MHLHGSFREGRWGFSVLRLPVTISSSQGGFNPAMGWASCPPETGRELTRVPGQQRAHNWGLLVCSWPCNRKIINWDALVSHPESVTPKICLDPVSNLWPRNMGYLCHWLTQLPNMASTHFGNFLVASVHSMNWWTVEQSWQTWRCSITSDSTSELNSPLRH